MKTNIGIATDKRKETADILSRVLADEYLLYTKTLRAHWNLEGHDFHTKHEFFEEHYNTLKSYIDSVAERIRKIGHYAPGTMARFLELTQLTENYTGDNSSASYIKALLADHEAIIRQVRNDIKNIEDNFDDAGTVDFLTGLMMDHEEMAWMLRSTVASSKEVAVK